MKYPIGIQTFEQIRTDGYVYIDKTAWVYQLATTGKIYFLSRPRRFGKSLLISTIKSYYQGRKDLFEGLAIEKLEKNWIQYPIFHMDFNVGCYTDTEGLKHRIESYLGDWEALYGRNPNKVTLGDRFESVLKMAAEQTGHKCVVLIDEYDKPILDVLDLEQEEINHNILKTFYSTFKSADAYLQFVMLTGVTKFSQVSVFSGFNQPNDISMDDHYQAICGITENELENYFAEPIEDFAKKLRCSIDEMKFKLKAHYDGYHFSSEMIDIFNPFSVLNAFSKLRLDDFWFASGTPTYLVKLLRHAKEQVNELTGKYYSISLFADYKADIEKPLPMIYQSGYFTIKGYDSFTNEYLLDFPNNEVKSGFLTMLANDYLKPKEKDVLSWISQSMKELNAGQTDNFRKELTAFLASIPYDSHSALKDIEMTEKHFQYTFYLIVRLMGTYCQIFNEKEYSQGRVDCILEMQDFVYILEFKLDGSALQALNQIKDKGYATPYLNDRRKVICIGAVFSSQTRTISEWESEILFA